MPKKQLRPAAPCQARTDLGICSATTPCDPEHTALSAARQLPPAVRRLAARFGLTAATASAVASANAWGRP